MKLSTKRRALIINGVLGVLLVGGAGVAYASLGNGSSSQAAPLTTRVTRGTVVSSVSASGSVESARTRSLDFGTSGTVESIAVESGDKVKKGRVLARIDDTAAQESLDAAKASLDAADDADTSTPSGYSQYISARNAYNAAKRAVAGTVIKAPFAGTIIAVNGSVGGSSGGGGSSSGSSSGSATGAGAGGSGGGGGSSSSASTSTGSGFIEIADPAKLQIVGQFTESDVTKLKVGQAATVSFDALTGVTATGKVSVIDPQPQTNNNVVQYAVTISLSGVPATVRLGQTASLQVIVSRADNALAVPSSSITTAGGQSTVKVLENGKQVVKPVQIGIKGDTTTEIKSGLQEGDQVVRNLPTTTGTGGGLPFGGGGGGLGGGGGFGGGGGGGFRGGRG
ncbi:RND transporter [Planotetraspora thailandica]|uniref:RND transporter n=1 Tax=Planotetraspora thailandica TaxID=487172 RepID=A0A8J3Y0B4_9ACTN|nr:HlyD family efflux transporter periplasmic adaptor subunit [Planotetraspora thailandica]GII58464.1 RND transporter [Planotetraspora thailandica]